LKRILLILGATLTLTIAAACGPGVNPTSTFPTNTTGPTLAPTSMPSEMPSDMHSEMPSELPSDGESPEAS
jgi:hypothetical protein